MPQTFAVIVTYQPDEALLTRLIDALAPQVSGGVVINNGHSLPITGEYLQRSGFTAVHLQANTGVAHALNAGFEWAQAHGAEFVITFDQDSEPAPDMVARLHSAYQGLAISGQKVGAVGPQQVDRRSGKRAVFLAPISWFRRRVSPPPGGTVEVDHLITSGCLVPIPVWQDVGNFMDELFIDYVDIEWSLRLRYRGWQLFGVGNATLAHSIGDNIQRFWGKTFPWHSPHRHYFIFRNGTYLQKLPHVSLAWKFHDAVQLAKKLAVFTLVGRPRAAHCFAMLRGIRDGWHGRLGVAPNSAERHGPKQTN